MPNDEERRPYSLKIVPVRKMLLANKGLAGSTHFHLRGQVSLLVHEKPEKVSRVPEFDDVVALEGNHIGAHMQQRHFGPRQYKPGDVLKSGLECRLECFRFCGCLRFDFR